MIIDFREKMTKEEAVASDESHAKRQFTASTQKEQGYKKLTINGLENSPEVSELLVKLHDHNRLYEIARDDSEEPRHELVQIMTDLLQFELSPTGHELIADVLIGLISKAEMNLRQALAERLAVMKDIPLRITLKLANDEIEVANPILKKSADLTDFDLIYILKAKGNEHGQAIAQRPQISDKLVNMLVDTLDEDIAFHLLENKNIILDERAMSGLTGMAEKSKDLAKPLLNREEITLELVTKIYKFVGEELKEYIGQNFDGIKHASLDDEIDSLVREFSNIEQGVFSPSNTLVQKAEYMLKNNQLTPAVMVDCLRQGQIVTFVAQMSVCCGLPVSCVERVVAEDTGRDLAAACVLAKINKSDFINMYLLTSRVRDSNIICESDLSKAIKFFDKMDERIAKSIFHHDRH